MKFCANQRGGGIKCCKKKKRSLARFSCDLKVVFCSAAIQKEEESNATMNASMRSSPEIEMNVFARVLFCFKSRRFQL